MALFNGMVFNSFQTEDMLAWNCVVRHLLSRAANGEHMVTGASLPTLSPHHPVAHGEKPELHVEMVRCSSIGMLTCCEVEMFDELMLRCLMLRWRHAAAEVHPKTDFGRI